MTKWKKYVEQSIKDCVNADDFEAKQIVLNEFEKVYLKKLNTMDEQSALQATVDEFGGVYNKFKKIKEEIVKKREKRKKNLKIFNFSVLTIGLLADAVALFISMDVFWGIIPIIIAIVIIQAVQLYFKIVDRKKLSKFTTPYANKKTYKSSDLPNDDDETTI